MKSYKLRLAVQVTLILILSGLTAYLIAKQYYFSAFFSISSIIILAFIMYRHIKKAIEVMERIIMTIQYADFNVSFRRSIKEKEFNHLCEMMDNAIYTFRNKLHNLEIFRIIGNK